MNRSKEKDQIELKQTLFTIENAKENIIININPKDQIVTFQDLFKEYNVFWSKDEYYTPNFEQIQKLNELDLMNIKRARDYITFIVNKKYMEYCRKSNITPAGMISIPEHMINTYANLANSWTSTKKDITHLINKIIRRYIDNNGKVYNTCCGKQINSALKDIEWIKNSIKKDYSLLLPDYQNENSFNFHKIELYDTYDTVNKDKPTKDSTIEYISRQVKTTQKIINWLIPQKYLAQPSIAIDNEECWKRGEKDKYGEFYNASSNYIVLSIYSYFNAVIHEYMHSVLSNDWKYGKKEICSGISDVLFELSKGNEIHWVGSKNGKEKYFDFKILDRKHPKKYLPYFTKLYSNKEVYEADTEVLSILVEELFTNRLGFNKIDVCKNIGYSLEEAVKINFNSICENHPIFGALLLTFFRGDFKR